MFAIGIDLGVTTGLALVYFSPTQKKYELLTTASATPGTVKLEILEFGIPKQNVLEVFVELPQLQGQYLSSFLTAMQGMYEGFSDYFPTYHYVRPASWKRNRAIKIDKDSLGTIHEADAVGIVLHGLLTEGKI